MKKHKFGNSIVKPNEVKEFIINKDKDYLEEIKRLKEEYIMLQNASDKVEEELQQRIDKAIEYIKGWQSFPHTNESTHNELRNLLNILKGVDKE